MFQSLWSRAFGRFTPPPPTVAVSLPQAVPVNPPRVAFTAQVGDAPPMQVLFPCVTRTHRLEPEAVLYVLIYRRSFERAVRYILLHGKVRLELHARDLPMLPLTSEGLTDDEVLAISVDDARAVLHAVRNPVECPTIEVDFDGNPLAASPNPAAPAAAPAASPVASSAAPAAQPAPAVHGPAHHSSPAHGDVVWAVEGVYDSHGTCPYEHPVTGKKGKPAFSITVVTADGTVKTVWGSYLQTALRGSGALYGDKIKLVKYPKCAIKLPHRTVHMNYWEVLRLDA